MSPIVFAFARKSQSIEVFEPPKVWGLEDTSEDLDPEVIVQSAFYHEVFEPSLHCWLHNPDRSDGYRFANEKVASPQSVDDAPVTRDEGRS